MCESYPPWPNPSNICSSPEEVDKIFDIRHFCTLAGPGGDPFRNKYCGNVLSDIEWEYTQQGSSCFYCSGHDGGLAATCGFSFHIPGCGVPIIGRGAGCKRKTEPGINPFRGDGELCCHRDMFSTNVDGTHTTIINHDNGELGDWDDTEYCFESADKRKTCQPKHRDIAGEGCYEDYYAEMCAGNGLSQDDFLAMLKNNWSESLGEYNRDSFTKGKPNCFYILSRQLFGPDFWTAGTSTLGTGTPPDESLIYGDSFPQAKRLMTDLYQNYSKAGFSILAPKGSGAYNEFGSRIFSICRAAPGLCTDFLNVICNGITMEDASRDPIKQMVCGCYLSETEYDHYQRDLQIGNRACVPICNTINNIPLSSGETVQKCSETICVMDNISVNITNSSIGNITFSQLCNDCGGRNRQKTTSIIDGRGSSTTVNDTNESCNCIIDGVTISAMNSRLGDIGITEKCGGNTKCKNLINGEYVDVDCSTGLPTPNSQRQAEIDEATSVRLFTLVGIGLGVALLVIIISVLINYIQSHRQRATDISRPDGK